MGKTGERAWRNTDGHAPKKKLNQTQKSGYKTGKTKERSWRNTYAPKKILNQTQKSGYNMGKTWEPAWRNTDTQKKKLKQTQKLFRVDDDHDDDDDDDVELLDTRQEQCELDENASPMSDSLSDDDDDDDGDDDDDDDDGDGSPLDIKQEQCELDENASRMSDSLVENFLSPQSGMICVQGYKVKRRNATILEAIFKKHGDIAAECVFKTDSVRSSILEVVCEVVRQIQTNDVIKKMEELECRVSDAEAANFDVTWLRAHLDAVEKRKETSKKYSMHMEVKENVILVKKVAQMDLRERCSELVVAQQRFKKAERCVRVLHLVEKNLNDHILDSKAKIDSWVNHPVV